MSVDFESLKNEEKNETDTEDLSVGFSVKPPTKKVGHCNGFGVHVLASCEHMIERFKRPSCRTCGCCARQHR